MVVESLKLLFNSQSIVYALFKIQSLYFGVYFDFKIILVTFYFHYL